MTEWISASEELPPYGEKVIVNVSRKTVDDRVFIGVHVPSPDRWYVSGFSEKNVTHWRPLPEPFKIIAGDEKEGPID